MWLGLPEDGLALKAVAEAVRIIAPVEDIILDGKLQKRASPNPAVKIRVIRHPQKRRVLFVSEYSTDPVTIAIDEKVDSPCVVIDLDSLEEVARLSPMNTRFGVTLDQQRVRMFYMGKDWPGQE